jgi:hypothetical protein
MQSGGGSIAIDNFRIYEGGVGPWRRDFENGNAVLTTKEALRLADLHSTRVGRSGLRSAKSCRFSRLLPNNSSKSWLIYNI